MYGQLFIYSALFSYHINLMDPNILLDPSLPFDQTKAQIFDRLIMTLYGPVSPQQAEADVILKNFKALPDSWLHTDAIIEYSTNPNSKFIALSILEEAINVFLVCNLDAMENTS